MGSYGLLLGRHLLIILMGSYGFLWVLMGSYGLL
jgi:hypothetical protein